MGPGLHAIPEIVSLLRQDSPIAGARFRRGLKAGIASVVSHITTASVWNGAGQPRDLRENVDAPTGGRRAPAIILGRATADLAMARIDGAPIPRTGGKIVPPA